MVWVIAFGELFFGDLWCVVWGYGGMRTHFSLLNPQCELTAFMADGVGWMRVTDCVYVKNGSKNGLKVS